MSIELVLLGGGAFAVEVATYFRDLGRAGWPSGDGREGGEATVTDVVSTSAAREDDLAAILGSKPIFHRDVSSVSRLEEKRVVICVGNSIARYKIYNDLARIAVRYWSVVHPNAYVAPTARIGAGVIVCPFAFIGPFAAVEANVAVNVGAMVGHDAVVRHSSTLSPGARLNGHASCGVAAFLGANSLLVPKVSMGHFSKLSAGSVLTKSVGDGFLMHGNPASGRIMIRIPADFGGFALEGGGADERQN